MEKSMDELINNVAQLEWEMFSTVNGEENKSSCQEKPDTFFAMRVGQLSAWSKETVESYLIDLAIAKTAGRNLMREKFLRMMESTSPAEFSKLKDELPQLDEETMLLQRELSELMLRQSAELYKRYPYITSSSRPLYSIEDREEITSTETYQKCELKNYSLKTLKLLKQHLETLSQQGISLNEQILESSLKHYGYNSIQEAEQKAEEYWQKRN